MHIRLRNSLCAILSVVLGALALPSPPYAQTRNNGYGSNNGWQQQQQQQQQWQRQQDQQRQDQARQQQQQQMRAQMQEQMRQQQQQQMRQQMQDQQRAQMQAQQRQALQAQQQQAQQRQLQQGRALGTVQQGTNKGTGMVLSNGMPRMNRPLTAGEIQRGFTGRVTTDGRALVKFQNRVFTVPASRILGLSARLQADRERAKPSSWAPAKQSQISSSIRSAALSSTSSVAVTSRLSSAQLDRMKNMPFKDDSVGAMRNPNPGPSKDYGKSAAGPTKIREISTPQGVARQSETAEALASREKVEKGATLYRMGTTNWSSASEGQYWSLENPLSPGYASRHGIPEENVRNANFIERATIKPGAEFITRPAPGAGKNAGGAIEVVVAPGDVRMQSFNHLGERKK